jgi:hypothetical protein
MLSGRNVYQTTRYHMLHDSASYTFEIIKYTIHNSTNNNNAIAVSGHTATGGIEE